MQPRVFFTCVFLLLSFKSEILTAGELLWVSKGSAPSCTAACTSQSLVNVTSEAGPACSVPMAGIPTAPATGNTGTTVDSKNAALGYVYVSSSCYYSTAAGTSSATVFGCLCQSRPDETSFATTASGKGCLVDCQTSGLVGVNFFGLPLCIRSINARFGSERNGVCFSEGDQTTLEDPVDRYTCVCAQNAGPSSGSGATGVGAPAG